MINILETQIAYYSLYFGQYFFFPYGNDEVHSVNLESLSTHFKDISYLLLKPLSLIDEKQCLRVAELWSGETFYKENLNLQMQYIFTYKMHLMPYKVCDYLRKEGFAVPFGDLSIEKLIDYGWLELSNG